MAMPSHAVLVVGGYLYIHYYCKFRHFFQGNFPVSVNYMNSLVKNNKSARCKREKWWAFLCHGKTAEA
ncbi:MAG: hypothetical protein DBY34_05040 [Oscillospiraceae bacterium]|nr:MAG: hypothetical protein DBY34_05040 [Oscillospiraceae bacterium]